LDINQKSVDRNTDKADITDSRGFGFNENRQKQKEPFQDGKAPFVFIL